MVSESSVLVVIKQLVEYGRAFPFSKIRDSEIELLESKKGLLLPPIVRQAFLTIGTGDHHLTGVFFLIDSDWLQSDLLQTEISSCNSKVRVVEEEFGCKYVDYAPSGKEFVIGMTDFLVFFIENILVTNPTVRCLFRNRGVVACQRSFSELLRGFRYFNNPAAIPQSSVDWAWFLQQVELNHFTTTIDQYSRQISEWAAAGRKGMPQQFQGHPQDESGKPFAEDIEFSIFHPDY